MARYQLDEPHFLDNRYYAAGTVVEWAGPPGSKMTPVDEVAKKNKDEYDESRPHLRASRDLPPKAYAVHDVMARRPGQPRVAGPPGQEPGPSADPADPVRTIETAEARVEFDQQDAQSRSDALDTSKPTAQEQAAQSRAQRKAAATKTADDGKSKK